jgi:hypothetical protein
VNNAAAAAAQGFDASDPFTFAIDSCGKKIFRVEKADSGHQCGTRSYLLAFSNSVISALRPEMSVEFEYRRLAAECLDLSKRSAALTDRTRLELADRVARKGGNAKRRNDGSPEHPSSHA